jgi:hypothetical protein
MRYFIDTEFLEGPQTKKFLGVPQGETKPTIDLISIGITASDGREYYAISKDFNLKEAWNRYDLGKEIGKPKAFEDDKFYWIRNNVLKPIHNELAEKEETWYHEEDGFFAYRSLKSLLNKYGKSNEQIAEEVKHFVNSSTPPVKESKEFYGYYADYDWVVFCWLFGYMKDLPACFPMYCKDLKQMLDEKAMQMSSWDLSKLHCPSCSHNIYEYIDETNDGSYKIEALKKYHPDFPKQENEHDALADARWNRRLFYFLKNL